MMSMRGLLVAVAITGIAHANPLGTTWRTQYPAKECSPAIDAGSELVGRAKTGLVFFDRATGKQRTLQAPAGAYVNSVVGDTVILGTSTVPIGIAAKTGAIRWKRPPAAKGAYRHVRPSGSTHAVEVEITYGTPVVLAVERFDATTGATAWKAPVPTKRARFTEVLTSTNHVYVISDDIKDQVGFTIVAFDLAGKQVWAIDDPIGYLPGFATAGDDLVSIKDNKIFVFAAATGKRSDWEVYWNAHPIVADGTLYATPVDHSVEAYEITGTKKWTTKLESRAHDTRVIGAASGIVYVLDGDFVHTLDAQTGKLLGSTGMPDIERFAIHPTAPALTRCGGASGRSLIASDPSTPAPEHRVKIRGRVRCKNCDASTSIEVHIGTTAQTLGPDRRFSLDVVARGTLSLEVRDASFPISTLIQQVDFNVDRTLTLGEVSVTVPEMGPGED